MTQGIYPSVTRAMALISNQPLQADDWWAFFFDIL